jgi:pimeloyl-ACP methyl ester carboxylesterase
MVKIILWSIALALLILLILGSFIYTRDMNQAYERIRGKSSVISSPYGNIEFIVGGDPSGTPVLVIHGGGGGYDQGELIAEVVLDDTFSWIAPSRFGYLGSELPLNASWDDQAAAYAFLLDHLGLESVAVVAMSQGGPSALLFALNFPDRVKSLTCLSCGAAALASEAQEEANKKGNILKTIFRYDVLYWTASKLFKKSVLGIIGATDEVIAGLTPLQKEKADQFVEFMNPAAPRSAGAEFDNTASMPGSRIAGITAPTLIFHAKDDMLQLYHNAEFAESNIPGSELISYETGGHILMIVQQVEIGEAVAAHIIRTGTPN